MKEAPAVEGPTSDVEAVKTAPADAAAVVPKQVKALKAVSAQPQSPTSAYRPGAFDTRAMAAPAAPSPSKPSKKWFSFTKSKSRSVPGLPP